MLARYAVKTVVAVAAFIGAVTATPHPECEPCAAITPVNLDALTIAGKYLCCDLSCQDEPVAGCGIFGLPLVCKACYDGDDTPAYDDPPIDEEGVSPTPAPVETSVVASTPSPVEASTVMASTPAPSEEFTTVFVPSTPTPVVASVAATAPPTEGFTTVIVPSTPTPVVASVAATAPPTEGSTVVAATAPPTEGFTTVFVPSTPTPVVLGSTPTPTEAPFDAEGISETMAPVQEDDDFSMSFTFTASPFPSTTSCTSCDSASTMLTPDDWEELEAAGLMLVCDPDCADSVDLGGCGAFGLPVECRAVGVDESGSSGDDASGSGSGSGSGGSGSSSGTGSGSGSSSGVSCSAQDEAMCADISPAQEEALAAYDNGGKIIVCDPTCVDGVSDPTHCNYFGLGQICRGCGSCSTCTPCP